MFPLFSAAAQGGDSGGVQSGVTQYTPSGEV